MYDIVLYLFSCTKFGPIHSLLAPAQHERFTPPCAKLPVTKPPSELFQLEPFDQSKLQQLET